jgi:glycosyltransferase involved in cell wall biosynthesis
MLCADTAGALAADHDVLVLTSAPRSSEHGLGAARDEVLPVRRELPFLEERHSDSFRAPLWALAGARAMRAAIAEHRPDLIFFFNASSIPHAALWVAQQSRVPIAFYVAHPFLTGLYRYDRFARHLLGDDRGIRSGWAAVVKLVNRLPQLRIAPDDPRVPLRASVAWVSEATRSQSPPPPFMKVGVTRVINPSTRRYEQFAAAARAPAPDEPVIAFVGRLEWQKGPDVAIRALAHLRRELGVRARLEIAGPGDGAYRASLERLSADAGVAEAVTFRGPLPIKGVIELLARAHAIVVPSVWQEPMAGICLEAAFARIPVVASLSGGMPEALRPDVEALYFPIGDAAACAEQLAAALLDPGATDERVRRARARAEGFTFDRFMDKIEEFIGAAALAANEAAVA